MVLTIVTQFIESYGVATSMSGIVAYTSMVLLVLLGAIIANFIVKNIVLRLVVSVIQKSKATWDDALINSKLLTRLSNVVPVLILYFALPVIFSELGIVKLVILRILLACLIVIAAMVLDSCLNILVKLSKSVNLYKSVAIRSYIQVLRLFMVFIAGIFVIATLMDKNPWALISGIGALSAVLLLVFKDTILGFVASLQLSLNKLVETDDWIEVPEYGADGTVIDVSLTTIKVQNWDKTITTIPTYSLISGSFKNWRGMDESGGRRIKRAINIDMNTVQFVNAGMLTEYKNIELLRDYIQTRLDEIAAYNAEHNVDKSSDINGRHLTNLGLFRAYLVEYLSKHPKIHKDMTFLVRHLDPTEKGLPIEIYVFSNDQEWGNYEDLQADIFDHILAALPKFHLGVYQSPSGRDFQTLRS